MSTRAVIFDREIRDSEDHRLIREANTRGEALFVPGAAEMPDGGEVIAETEGIADALLPGIGWTGTEENPEPLRQRIFKNVRRSKYYYLLRRVLGKLVKRELTEEEEVILQEEEKRKQLETLLRKEGEILVEKVINVLTRRELCYRYKKSERDFIISGVQKVSFDWVGLQPEALYLRVDTKRLPRGVGVMQLITEDILTDLSLSVGHKVSAEYAEDIGCWYIVERASGVRGIPNHVRYAEIIKLFPKSADRLTIPLGYGQNKKPLFRSIAKMPHLLVAGTTGSGKTNMLNVILVTLLSRNTQDQLKLVMIDLKGGLAFSAYAGIPHLMPIKDTNGIIEYRKDVVPVLTALIHEGERRMEIIKNDGHQDIDYYNAKHHNNKLPRILCIIDEFSDTKLDREISKDAYEAVKNIAQRMRAVGIHLVMCTQVPTVEVIPTLLKTNLPAKIAFSMPTITGSLVIIDNSSAYGLEPEGRFVFQKGKENILAQAPYMPPQILNEYIQAIREGKPIEGVTDNVPELTIEEIISWAVTENEGFLSNEKVWDHYKDKGLITRDQLRELLRSVEESVIPVGEFNYEIVPTNGPVGRKAVLVELEKLE